GIFFTSHAAGFVAVGIIKARFLTYGAAVFDELNLAPRLVLDGALEKPERVEVLDFAPRAEFGLPFWTYRNVGVATERAFLHIAVANTQPHHQRMQGASVGNGLGCRAHLGLGHNLKQGRACTVQVDASRRLTV